MVESTSEEIKLDPQILQQVANQIDDYITP